MTAQQLPLALGLRDDATFANFHPPGEEGERLLRLLRDVAAGRYADPVYLFGPLGCGRSHLLQACCREAESFARTAAYLPLDAAGSGLSAAVLDSLESLDLVAVDGIETVAGDRNWEEGLFHLFNRCQESTCALLWCGNQAPAEQGLLLPDLASRLAGGMVVRVPTTRDVDREAILVQRARARGMDLAPDIARFILQRAPRDLHSLMAILDQLDSGSLAAGRRLTLPFVKATLDL